MKEKFIKLIDLKSIITLTLVWTMVYIIVSGRPVDEKLFLLFSNLITMIVTFFFTKKKEGE
jgi:uncharacterized membrane protein